MAGDGHHGLEGMMKTKILAALILIVFVGLVVAALPILVGGLSLLEVLLAFGIGISVPIAFFAVMWAVLELFGE
jgi:hypothetical protein